MHSVSEGTAGWRRTPPANRVRGSPNRDGIIGTSLDESKRRARPESPLTAEPGRERRAGPIPARARSPARRPRSTCASRARRKAHEALSFACKAKRLADEAPRLARKARNAASEGGVGWQTLRELDYWSRSSYPVREPYAVALSRNGVEHLRALLSEACEVFAQKSIYLCIAGQVEFIEGRKYESGGPLC